MQIFAVWFVLLFYERRLQTGFFLFSFFFKVSPEPNKVVSCCYRPEARWSGSPRIKSFADPFPHNIITTLTCTEMQNTYVQRSNQRKANDTSRKSISLRTKILRWTYILERIIGFLKPPGGSPKYGSHTAALKQSLTRSLNGHKEVNESQKCPRIWMENWTLKCFHCVSVYLVQAQFVLVLKEAFCSHSFRK